VLQNETMINNISDFKMVAKTMHGLEELLSDEMLKLGARDIEIHKRAVSFVGDQGFLYKANLCSRVALSILKHVKTFTAIDQHQLYDEIKNISWEDYMGADDTLAVDCSLNSQYFNHSLFVAQKTKDAIVDRLKEKFGKRPSVDLENPTLRVDLHYYKDTCTVSLNSSGAPLFKRGYRTFAEKAPINEVLAAGMVLLSGWDKRSNFVDPMCGSGTLAIEAALIAGNIPPGYYRENFGFMNWKDYDEELWKKISESSIGKISNEQPAIYASDISATAIRVAGENIVNAKVDDAIKLKKIAIENIEPPQGRGIAIINPPYGERLNSGEDIAMFYKTIGDTMKKKFSGYDVWIISSNMEALKNIGLRPTRRITLFNGALECKFLKFSIYDGTKKIHKLKEKDTNNE